MSAADQGGGVETGGMWVVIPYKGPVGSKRRLAPLLDDRERRRLSQTLFESVLDAVLGTPRVSKVLVIQPPNGPIPAHRYPRVNFVTEAANGGSADRDAAEEGLNRALVQAQRTALEGGAPGLLMLPSDLPMITPSDVDALAQAATDAAVVVAPDRASEGTNALLLRPPDTMPTSFGAGSFARHQALAAEAGLRTAVVRRWGLALDLDTPADVLRLYALAPDCAAARVLQKMGVTVDRIARLGLTGAVSSGA